MPSKGRCAFRAPSRVETATIILPRLAAKLSGNFTELNRMEIEKQIAKVVCNQHGNAFWDNGS